MGVGIDLAQQRPLRGKQQVHPRKCQAEHLDRLHGQGFFLFGEAVEHRLSPVFDVGAEVPGRGDPLHARYRFAPADVDPQVPPGGGPDKALK